VQHQLAERTHQEVGDHADEGVAEQQRRAGAVQARGRAQEQPGPDRSADGDHLNVPAPEGLLVPRLLGVQGVVWSIFGLRQRFVLTCRTDQGSGGSIASSVRMARRDLDNS